MTYPYSVGFALQLIKRQTVFSSDFTKKTIAIRHFSRGPIQFLVLVFSATHLPVGLPNHLAESHWLSFGLKISSCISPSFPLCIPPYPSPCCHISQQLLLNLAYAQSLAEQNWCAEYGVHHAIITSGIFAMLFGTCYSLSFQWDFRKQESSPCGGCIEVKQSCKCAAAILQLQYTHCSSHAEWQPQRRVWVGWSLERKAGICCPGALVNRSMIMTFKKQLWRKMTQIHSL